MTDINDWIQKHIDEDVVTVLQDYIRIPAQSRIYDPHWATNGLNERLVQLAADFATKMNIAGLQIQIITEEGKPPCIMAVFDAPNKPNVLIFGHLDKQPPLAEQWAEGLSPYEPVMKGDKLYGRAAADDGYAFFTAITLLKAMQLHGVDMPRVVIFFETDEESGSRDVVHYLNNNKKLVGDPDLIISLDSTCFDYDHLCMTTSLKGLLDFTLKVEVSNDAVHNGMGGGIVPDPFRIGRTLLEALENGHAGYLTIPELYPNIPEDKYIQACQTVREMKTTLDTQFSLIKNVKPITVEPLKQLLNRSWYPFINLIGIDGVPTIARAGNAILSNVTFGLSMRIPPNLDPKLAQKLITNFFDKMDKPNNAKVTVDFQVVGPGFISPLFHPMVEKIIDDSGKLFFGKPVLKYGEGSTIPLMTYLSEKYPNAQFIGTGVLGPECNAHGPNEFLHIPYLKKFACALAHIITNFGAIPK